MAIRRGTEANNRLNGTGAADRLYGAGGNDTLLGLGGRDLLYGGGGNDVLRGGAGNDRLFGDAGNDRLYGDTGDDRLSGDAGNDWLSGDSGNDWLAGGSGNDTLFGGSGNDTLAGGSGNDWLYANSGNDVLTGGGGADTFVLVTGRTRVTDFSAREGDVIDLRPALGNYRPNTDSLSDFVRVSQNSGTTFISVDANGDRDGRANFVNVAEVKGTGYANLGAIVQAGSLLVPGGTNTGGDGDGDGDGGGGGGGGTSGDIADFRDFLGVNIEVAPEHASYGSGAKMNASLDYLNISNVRVAAESPIGSNRTGSIYEALANNDIDFDFLMRRDFPEKGGKQLINEYVEHFKDFLRQNPGSINAIEGLNEVGGDWTLRYNGLPEKEAAAAYQRDLYTAINNDPVLKDIPVYNFTVHESYLGTTLNGYADMSNYSDAANAHTYIVTTRLPYEELGGRLNLVERLDGNSPTVITEFGYPTNVVRGNSMAVDQQTQAKLMLNMIMNAYEQKVPAAYIYELYDMKANVPNDNKMNFGLFTSTGAPKQAATAIHNLTEILYQNSGSGPVEAVKYDLNGDDSNTHSVALAKAGGVTDLVIWREQLIWDHKSSSRDSANARTIQVELDQTAKYVDVYDPIDGTSVQQHFTNTDVVNVQVTDHPIILEIGL